MKSSHMLLCGGLAAGAVVLVAVGADALALVPMLACGAMMGAMMWMMMRGSGDGG